MTKTTKVTLTRPIHNGHTITATITYKNGVVVSIHELDTCPKSGGEGWLTRAQWGDRHWDAARIERYLSRFPNVR
jgi:hypothetical protein